MEYEQLKLENQLCFPVYAASRLITREYQPYLDELGITYPQYLVMLILWEHGMMPVNDIAKKLILNTNTITPLLKRMQQQGLVVRERSATDERKVMVKLSEAGQQLKEPAARIPLALANQLINDKLNLPDLIQLKSSLDTIIELLSQKAK